MTNKVVDEFDKMMEDVGATMHTSSNATIYPLVKVDAFEGGKFQGDYVGKREFDFGKGPIPFYQFKLVQTNAPVYHKKVEVKPSVGDVVEIRGNRRALDDGMAKVKFGEEVFVLFVKEHHLPPVAPGKDPRKWKEFKVGSRARQATQEQAPF